MRICRLRFQNLNSLAGEWSIDFTDPQYALNGIFVITGPTGSGKTTILDALALAIFGRTPRLDKITGSSNELMSRQTGECFAEAEFEAGGQRYLCHWSQRRARGHATGTLQQPKHQIADAVSGKILEEKPTRVPQRVEEITGLDFPRFTRSVLLAQGEFAAFLQAPPEEKSPLLERITGTQIYSQISRKVHEITKERRLKLAELEDSQVNSGWLGDAEEEALRNEILAVNQTISAAKKQLDGIRSKKQWLEEAEQLQKELADLDGRLKSAKEERQNASAELELLAQARRANRVKPAHTKLLELKESSRKMAELLESDEQDLLQKQSALENAIKALEKLQAESLALSEHETKERKQIKEARRLDLQLEDKQQLIQQLSKRLVSVQGDLAAKQQQKDKLVISQKELSRKISSLENYFEGILNSEELAEDVSNAKAQLADWSGQDSRLKKKQQFLAERSVALSSALEQMKTAEAALRKMNAETSLSMEAEKKAQNEKSELLAGATESIVRQQLSAKQGSCRQMAALLEIQERIARLQTDAEEYKRQADSGLARQAEVTAAGQALGEQLKLQAANVAHLAKQRELELKIISLEEERKRLVDGQPCPLCGSEDHPFSGGVAGHDATEQELEKARSQQSKLEKEQSELRQEFVSLKTAIAFAEKESAKLTNELNALRDNAKVMQSALNWDESKGALTELITQEKAESEKLESQLQRAEKLQEQLKSMSDSLQRLKESAARKEAEFGRLQAQVEALRQEAERMETETSTEQKEADVARRRLVQLLETHSVSIKDHDDDAASATAELENHLKERQTKQDELSRLKSLMSEQKISGAGLDESLLSLRKTCEERQAELAKAEDEHSQAVEQRKAVYAHASADEGEAALNARLDNMRLRLEQGTLSRQALQHQVDALQKSIRDRRSEQASLHEKFSSADEKFKSMVEAEGFLNETDFLSACLPEQRTAELDDEERRMDKNEAEINSLLQDRRQRLEQNQEQKLTEESLATLASHLEETEAGYSEKSRIAGAWQQTLDASNQARQKLKERLPLIEAQKHECARWDELDELVGSADGKKFRLFAQGITFDMLIAKANQRLAGLSGRYALARDDSRPLEFSVADSYQGGEIRPTRNLSGGESFIVSLALALGLAEMSGDQTPISSLFLDEGFGTLDEESLETVLVTLTNLKHEGKLIGIVSHVAELNERISVRISVLPSLSGSSRLSGPGCT